MIKKVSHISIFVTDQNIAFDFYSNKLGLILHTDAAFGTERWLTLTTKEDKEFEICLILSKDFKPHSAPILAFLTDDCYKEFEDLKSKGVQFLSEPKDEPWGIGTTFKDPFGNLLYLNQPKKG